MRKIGVFTSGGDAPGMNAAIRAVTRTLLSKEKEVWGIIGGYSGLLASDFQALNSRALANIIQRGGTVLKTGRCPEFMKAPTRAKAAEILKAQNIDGLICIGGDGSFAGAHALWLEHQIPWVGLPATIDNDIYGTDDTIGFDTAVNTALEAIDRIRDTATSHDRIFIIEVMGRDSGFIAASVGLAGGAEEIFTPEHPQPVDKVVGKLKLAIANGKKSSILVAAEGQKAGRVYDLAEQIRKKIGLEPKVAVLGHQQRGGSPTAFDRILASRMGYAAAMALISGESDIYIGNEGSQLIRVPVESALVQKKLVSKDYVQLASLLSH